MVGEKQTNNMAFKMKSSIQKLCSPLQSVENPGDNEIKTYVPGVDGPKYVGGTVPNPAKSAYNIAKTIGKGAKYLYDKTRGKTTEIKS